MRKFFGHFVVALTVGALAPGSEVRGEGVVSSLIDPRLMAPLPYRIYRPEDQASGGAGRAAPPRGLLLLHGHGGSENQWVRAGMAEATLDRLVMEEAIEPHLLVMPGVGNSWYVDSEAHGAVATVIMDRLLPQVAAEHGIEDWAIAGLSMGGYGALHLGFRHPETFDFIAALSPAVFPPETEFSDLQYKLFGPAFGMPFDRMAYERANPFAAIRAELPPVYLSVGDDDYFGLDQGTLQLYLDLRAAGHMPELRVHDAGHIWPLWRREFEALLRSMAQAKE